MTLKIRESHENTPITKLGRGKQQKPQRKPLKSFEPQKNKKGSQPTKATGT